MERAKNVSNSKKIIVPDEVIKAYTGRGGGAAEVQLHNHSLSSALDGGEWSVSYPDRFTFRETAHDTT